MNRKYDFNNFRRLTTKFFLRKQKFEYVRIYSVIFPPEPQENISVVSSWKAVQKCYEKQPSYMKELVRLH